jgi:hypothetical protein
MTECNKLCKSNAEHMERHAQGLGCINEDQFTKHDQGKPDVSLIPPCCIIDLAEHLTYGASKYRANNWKKGSKDRYYSALQRHLLAWHNGETFDEDGKRHLVAVFTNAMFLLWMDKQREL